MIKLTKKEYLGSYLAGLFEATGTIYIPKSKKYPKVIFSLNKNNRSLLEAIKDRIGFGAIYDYPNKNICRYEIFNREGVLKFIELTKDYLRTPKIISYNNMIKHLNIITTMNLSIAEIDNNDFSNHAWLSGWLETNGSYFLREHKNSEYCNNMEMEFTISHKIIDKDNQSYEPFMKSLADFFKRPLNKKTISSKDNSKGFIITLWNPQDLNILLKYYNNFPLFGKKYLDYSNFYSALQLKFDYEIGQQVHYLELQKEIKNLKNEMNSKRTEFLVEHLNLLPNPNKYTN